MELKLNVYDETGNITKTAKAETLDLEFGSIRSLMELLNIENIEDTGALLKTVYCAWDQITYILGQCFPEMEYEDWDHVKLKELMPMIIDILRFSFGEILTIPKSSKN